MDGSGEFLIDGMKANNDNGNRRNLMQVEMIGEDRQVSKGMNSESVDDQGKGDTLDDMTSDASMTDEDEDEGMGAFGPGELFSHSDDGGVGDEAMGDDDKEGETKSKDGSRVMNTDEEYVEQAKSEDISRIMSTDEEDVEQAKSEDTSRAMSAEEQEGEVEPAEAVDISPTMSECAEAEHATSRHTRSITSSDKEEEQEKEEAEKKEAERGKSQDTTRAPSSEEEAAQGKSQHVRRITRAEEGAKQDETEGMRCLVSTEAEARQADSEHTSPVINGNFATEDGESANKSRDNSREKGSQQQHAGCVSPHGAAGAAGVEEGHATRSLSNERATTAERRSSNKEGEDVVSRRSGRAKKHRGARDHKLFNETSLREELGEEVETDGGTRNEERPIASGHAGGQAHSTGTMTSDDKLHLGDEGEAKAVFSNARRFTGAKEEELSEAVPERQSLISSAEEKDGRSADATGHSGAQEKPGIESLLVSGKGGEEVKASQVGSHFSCNAIENCVRAELRTIAHDESKRIAESHVSSVFQNCPGAKPVHKLWGGPPALMSPKKRGTEHSNVAIAMLVDIAGDGAGPHAEPPEPPEAGNGTAPHGKPEAANGGNPLGHLLSPANLSTRLQGRQSRAASRRARLAASLDIGQVAATVVEGPAIPSAVTLAANSAPGETGAGENLSAGLSSASSSPTAQPQVAVPPAQLATCEMSAETNASKAVTQVGVSSQKAARWLTAAAGVPPAATPVRRQRTPRCAALPALGALAGTLLSPGGVGDVPDVEAIGLKTPDQQQARGQAAPSAGLALRGARPAASCNLGEAPPSLPASSPSGGASRSATPPQAGAGNRQGRTSTSTGDVTQRAQRPAPSDGDSHGLPTSLPGALSSGTPTHSGATRQEPARERARKEAPQEASEPNGACAPSPSSLGSPDSAHSEMQGAVTPASDTKPREERAREKQRQVAPLLGPVPCGVKSPVSHAPGSSATSWGGGSRARPLDSSGAAPCDRPHSPAAPEQAGACSASSGDSEALRGQWAWTSPRQAPQQTGKAVSGAPSAIPSRANSSALPESNSVAPVLPAHDVAALRGESRRPAAEPARAQSIAALGGEGAPWKQGARTVWPQIGSPAAPAPSGAVSPILQASRPTDSLRDAVLGEGSPGGGGPPTRQPTRSSRGALAAGVERMHCEADSLAPDEPGSPGAAPLRLSHKTQLSSSARAPNQNPRNAGRLASPEIEVSHRGAEPLAPDAQCVDDALLTQPPPSGQPGGGDTPRVHMELRAAGVRPRQRASASHGAYLLPGGALSGPTPPEANAPEGSSSGGAWNPSTESAQRRPRQACPQHGQEGGSPRPLELSAPCISDAREAYVATGSLPVGGRGERQQLLRASSGRAASHLRPTPNGTDAPTFAAPQNSAASHFEVPRAAELPGQAHGRGGAPPAPSPAAVDFCRPEGLTTPPAPKAVDAVRAAAISRGARPPGDRWASYWLRGEDSGELGPAVRVRDSVGGSESATANLLSSLTALRSPRWPIPLPGGRVWARWREPPTAAGSGVGSGAHLGADAPPPLRPSSTVCAQAAQVALPITLDSSILQRTATIDDGACDLGQGGDVGALPTQQCQPSGQPRASAGVTTLASGPSYIASNRNLIGSGRLAPAFSAAASLPPPINGICHARRLASCVINPPASYAPAQRRSALQAGGSGPAAASGALRDTGATPRAAPSQRRACSEPHCLPSVAAHYAVGATLAGKGGLSPGPPAPTASDVATPSPTVAPLLQDAELPLRPTADSVARRPASHAPHLELAAAARRNRQTGSLQYDAQAPLLSRPPTPSAQRPHGVSSTTDVGLLRRPASAKSCRAASDALLHWLPSLRDQARPHTARQSLRPGGPLYSAGGAPLRSKSLPPQPRPVYSPGPTARASGAAALWPDTERPPRFAPALPQSRSALYGRPSEGEAAATRCLQLNSPNRHLQHARSLGPPPAMYGVPGTPGASPLASSSMGSRVPGASHLKQRPSSAPENWRATSLGRGGGSPVLPNRSSPVRPHRVSAGWLSPASRPGLYQGLATPQDARSSPPRRGGAPGQACSAQPASQPGKGPAGEWAARLVAAPAPGRSTPRAHSAAPQAQEGPNLQQALLRSSARRARSQPLNAARAYGLHGQRSAATTGLRRRTTASTGFGAPSAALPYSPERKRMGRTSRSSVGPPAQRSAHSRASSTAVRTRTSLCSVGQSSKVTGASLFQFEPRWSSGEGAAGLGSQVTPQSLHGERQPPTSLPACIASKPQPGTTPLSQLRTGGLPGAAWPRPGQASPDCRASEATSLPLGREGSEGSAGAKPREGSPRASGQAGSVPPPEALPDEGQPLQTATLVKSRRFARPATSSDSAAASGAPAPWPPWAPMVPPNLTCAPDRQFGRQGPVTGAAPSSPSRMMTAACAPRRPLSPAAAASCASWLDYVPAAAVQQHVAHNAAGPCTAEPCTHTRASQNVRPPLNYAGPCLRAPLPFCASDSPPPTIFPPHLFGAMQAASLCTVGAANRAYGDQEQVTSGHPPLQPVRSQSPSTQPSQAPRPTLTALSQATQPPAVHRLEASCAATLACAHHNTVATCMDALQRASGLGGPPHAIPGDGWALCSDAPLREWAAWQPLEQAFSQHRTSPPPSPLYESVCSDCLHAPTPPPSSHYLSAVAAQGAQEGNRPDTPEVPHLYPSPTHGRDARSQPIVGPKTLSLAQRSMRTKGGACGNGSLSVKEGRQAAAVALGGDVAPVGCAHLHGPKGFGVARTRNQEAQPFAPRKQHKVSRNQGGLRLNHEVSGARPLQGAQKQRYDAQRSGGEEKKAQGGQNDRLRKEVKGMRMAKNPKITGAVGRQIGPQQSATPEVLDDAAAQDGRTMAQQHIAFALPIHLPCVRPAAGVYFARNGGFSRGEWSLRSSAPEFGSWLLEGPIGVLPLNEAGLALYTPENEKEVASLDQCTKDFFERAEQELKLRKHRIRELA